MKYSQLFFNNNSFERNNENFELIDLMRKACLVHQDSSGIFSWLSLGFILEQKVEKIIQEEMENIGFSQMRLSILQDADLWKATGRFDTYGAELFKLKNRKDHEFCLGATCEEAITNIVKNHYNNTQMNVNVYQIGNKYRDELRAKAGLMRSKEFIMKDGYSFASSEEKLEATYQEVRQAYCNIFDRLGLKYSIVSSDNGEIGGKSSEEFHCESIYGEEEVDGKTTLEVAHIFNLGQEYSKKMEVFNNIKEHVHMGCFGIGISRLVMALLEQQRDKLGFYGTEEFNTFHTVISVIDYKAEEHQQKAIEIYKFLKSKGVSVLLDDRDVNAGKKMSDSELIGCVRRIIVSKQSFKNNAFEVLHRKDQIKESVAFDSIFEYLSQ